MNRTFSKKTSTCIALVALIALTAMSSIAIVPMYANGPTLLKRTLIIKPWRFASYWRDKKADSPEWDTWSWIPRIAFYMMGPIEGGSQVQVDYVFPDGKPWFTQDLYTEELQDGHYAEFATPGGHERPVEELATLKTGLFGYSIRVKNELNGTNTVLMAGKFKVDKIHVGIPQRPNEFEYFADQDWRLPIGYVWIEDNSLHIGMWIRGNEWKNGKYTGHLLYNGKPIYSTEEMGSSVSMWNDILTVGNRLEDPAWTQAIFEYTAVIPTREGLEGRDELHFLVEKPGEYEMKMLFKGKLVRSVKFTVGPDGKFVDNGIASSNAFGDNRLIVPVSISGDLDGKWNRNAWKDEAFYYNPLKGFTAP